MFTALIRAGRILNVEKVTDLTAAYAPVVTDGVTPAPFSIFLVPAVGSTVLPGDVVIVNGKLPYGAAATDVPVIVGDWSPVVFESISASGVDLDDVDLYAAPIRIDK